MGKRRDQLNEFYAGMKYLKTAMPENKRGFDALVSAQLKEGVLSEKTKELMALAVACYTRCEYCIVAHVFQALKLGAVKDEILEAAMVSVVFGGGPAIAYIATVVKECLDEFCESV